MIRTAVRKWARELLDRIAPTKTGPHERTSIVETSAGPRILVEKCPPVPDFEMSMDTWNLIAGQPAAHRWEDVKARSKLSLERRDQILSEISAEKRALLVEQGIIHPSCASVDDLPAMNGDGECKKCHRWPEDPECPHSEPAPAPPKRSGPGVDRTGARVRLARNPDGSAYNDDIEKCPVFDWLGLNGDMMDATANRWWDAGCYDILGEPEVEPDAGLFTRLKKEQEALEKGVPEPIGKVSAPETVQCECTGPCGRCPNLTRNGKCDTCVAGICGNASMRERQPEPTPDAIQVGDEVEITAGAWFGYRGVVQGMPGDCVSVRICQPRRSDTLNFAPSELRKVAPRVPVISDADRALLSDWRIEELRRLTNVRKMTSEDFTVFALIRFYRANGGSK